VLEQVVLQVTVEMGLMIMPEQVDVVEMVLVTVGAEAEEELVIHLEQELNQVRMEEAHHPLELEVVVQVEQELKENTVAEVVLELQVMTEIQVQVENQVKEETLQVQLTLLTLLEVLVEAEVLVTLEELHVQEEEELEAAVPY
jgi:hypothetical protein